MAWCSLGDFRVWLGNIRDAHDDVLGASEHASVRRVFGGDELHLGGEANGVSHLLSAFGHGVGTCVEADVHVGSEEGVELGANEEPLASAVLESLLPNKFFLADGRHQLVFNSVQVLSV